MQKAEVRWTEEASRTPAQGEASACEATRRTQSNAEAAVLRGRGPIGTTKVAPRMATAHRSDPPQYKRASQRGPLSFLAERLGLTRALSASHYAVLLRSKAGPSVPERAFAALRARAGRPGQISAGPGLGARWRLERRQDLRRAPARLPRNVRYSASGRKARPAPCAPLRMSVSVSAVQLQHRDFTAVLISAVEAAAVSFFSPEAVTIAALLAVPLPEAGGDWRRDGGGCGSRSRSPSRRA